MLSREKGQHYGEGHQKASQISTGLLPLVAALSREEARCLPGLKPQRNAGHRVMRACAPWQWGACREADDAFSCDEATEISTVTLLLTLVRLCCEEERWLPLESQYGGGPTGGCSISIANREDGHPPGWPLVFACLRLGCESSATATPCTSRAVLPAGRHGCPPSPLSAPQGCARSHQEAGA